MVHQTFLHCAKSFCTVKETLNKMKKHPTEWQKILANDISNRELISIVYKEFMQLNNKTTSNLMKIWVEDLSRHLSKEDIHVTKTHEEMLNITNIREMHLKTIRIDIPPHTCQNGCRQKISP